MKSPKSVFFEALRAAQRRRAEREYAAVEKRQDFVMEALRTGVRLKVCRCGGPGDWPHVAHLSRRCNGGS